MIARVARIGTQVVLMLAVLYATLVGLGLLLTKVVDDEWPVSREDAVVDALVDGRTPALDDVTHGLSWLGATPTIVITVALVAGLLRLTLHRWDASVFLVLAVSAQALVFLLTTMAIDRQRPHVPRLDTSPPTSSFPSGHTGAATALFVGAALLVAWHVRKGPVKAVAFTLLLAIPLLVGYSRLYRGMHHPTDLLAAYLNALTCLAIAGVAVLGRGLWGGRPDPPPAPALAGANRGEPPSSTTR